MKETTGVSDNSDSDLLKLWDLGWEGAVQSKIHSHVSGDNDRVSAAINSASGKLAQTLLSLLWQRNPTRGSGFPNDLESRFAKMASGDSEPHHLARVIFAAHLESLHAISPLWANRELIARMLFPKEGNADDNAVREAVGLWTGYGWSPRIGPSLLEDIRAPLLSAVPRLELVPGNFREQLVGMFAEVIVEATTAFDENQIRHILRGIPADNLQDCANQFRYKLESAGSRATDLWNNSLSKIFLSYWPAARAAVTPRTSAAIARMLLATRESFPNALATVKERGLLCPIHDPGHLLRLLSNRVQPTRKRGDQDEETLGYDVANKEPGATLEMLGRIIDVDLATWCRSDLARVLRIIADSKPTLAAAPEFRHLDEISKLG